MIRILSWLITLPIFLLLLSFALANRHDVTLSFWPFDAEITMPLSIVVIGFLFAGMILGAFITWMTAIPQRLQARTLRRELAAANKRLDEQQAILTPSPKADYDELLFDRPRRRISGL